MISLLDSDNLKCVAVGKCRFAKEQRARENSSFKTFTSAERTVRDDVDGLIALNARDVLVAGKSVFADSGNCDVPVAVAYGVDVLVGNLNIF